MADNIENTERNKKDEKKKKFIIMLIIIIVTLLVGIVFPLIEEEETKRKGKENPNDIRNAPAAANGFINNTYIDENGKIKMEKSISELWSELIDNRNEITSYLSSAEELAKLLTASMATDYPDTRKNPDDPIDWSIIENNINSTDVQGIVKFKRALQNGETITMTYLPPSEFQKKMNNYNTTGKKEDREEALKYFTIEKSQDSGGQSVGGQSTGGYVDISSRSLNNDSLEASNNVVDVYEKTNRLFNKRFDAIQSASFDGKYIICSANEGKHGHSGGRVFWVDIETGNVLPNYVTIGSEGNHMTGQTYDSERKVVLVTSVPSEKLIQIDNQTKQMMNPKYVTIPKYFHVITYSPTTKELIGYRNKKLTFMKYDSSKNEYVEQRTVSISGSFNFSLQGMSTDGQVIYFLDSTNDSSKKDKFRVWVYDFQGNLIEEHKIGDSFRSTASEVEDCFCDKEGNLWLVMPYAVTKIRNYKAHPVDWENNYSPMPTQTETGGTAVSGSFEQLEEILQYACKYVGKMKYEGSHYEPLKEGGKISCSGFVYAVFKEFGLMNIKFSHAGTGSWKKGDIPGTEQVESLSQATPGDVLWTNTTERTCCNLSW